MGMFAASEHSHFFCFNFSLFFIAEPVQWCEDGQNSMDKIYCSHDKMRSYGPWRQTSYRYGFFDRHGGNGIAPYDSMNVSYGVGDAEETVSANRRRVEEISGFPVFLSAKQVHGNEIYCLTKPLTASLEIEGVDALITDQDGVGLMIQQADCQAVLLFDSSKKIIAAIHCGWRGSVANIVARVIRRMKDGFGVAPVQLQALISPSLGPCCAEFINYQNELPAEFAPFMARPDHFDFWQLSKSQLIAAGVRETKISSVWPLLVHAAQKITFHTEEPVTSPME